MNLRLTCDRSLTLSSDITYFHMSLSDEPVNTLTNYERNVSHFCTLSSKKGVVQDIMYHNSSQEQHDLCKTSENKNKGLGSYVVKKATF